jgi:branched-chain amino acid transport system ATP-binding protein
MGTDTEAAGSATPLIELRHVHAGYGQMTILREVDLVVAPGEVLGIVGANGAGKTTLLRTISRLTRITSGSLEICGRDATQWRPSDVSLQGVGHVLEGRRVLRGMTVRDNLLIGQRGSRAEASERLEQVFTLFPRLKERHRQRAETMSGGEQQMLAIGRVLMTRPKLIMFDEPSQGLSPLVVDNIMDNIRQIASTGLGVMIVEQNLELVRSISDRAVIVNRGKVSKNKVSTAEFGSRDLAIALLTELSGISGNQE